MDCEIKNQIQLMILPKPKSNKILAKKIFFEIFLSYLQNNFYIETLIY